MTRNYFQIAGAAVALAFLITSGANASDPKSPAPPACESLLPPVQDDEDHALAAVRRLDRQAPAQTSSEHLRRAAVYLTFRAFPEAREHFQAVIDRGAADPLLSSALNGMGRSFFLERRYTDAFRFFDRAAREFPDSHEGREGLNFSGAALLRGKRPLEAVDRYREYIQRYPLGERLDTAYLNVIDGLREAGRPAEAIPWIARTRERFAGTATATNAEFALLRLYISSSEWEHAIATADELRGMNLSQPGVSTGTAEISYLRAYCLERAGRNSEAIAAYLAIPDSITSYYGALATERLSQIRTTGTASSAVNARREHVSAEAAASAGLYPAAFRETILRVAEHNQIDPRIVLAIMRQESNFRTRARSVAGARGLLQLTYDIALGYTSQAGVNGLRETDLYRPEINIAIGGAYLAALARLFPDTTAAVIASYNGGEDNVGRWLQRARQSDAGVFTAEIGFAETKDYVAKVMSNLRVYRLLYTSRLVPAR